MSALAPVILAVAAATAASGATAPAEDLPSHPTLPREVQRGDQVCLQRLDAGGALVERCPDGVRYEVLSERLGRRLLPPPAAPEPIPSGAMVPYGSAGLWELDLSLHASRYTQEVSYGSRRVDAAHTRVGGTVRLGGFPLAGWRGAAIVGFEVLAVTHHDLAHELSFGGEIMRLFGGPSMPLGLRPFVGLQARLLMGPEGTLPDPVRGILGGVVGGVRVPVSTGWGLDARLLAGRRFAEAGSWDLGASASLFFVLPTGGGA